GAAASRPASRNACTEAIVRKRRTRFSAVIGSSGSITATGCGSTCGRTSVAVVSTHSDPGAVISRAQPANQSGAKASTGTGMPQRAAVPGPADGVGEHQHDPPAARIDQMVPGMLPAARTLRPQRPSRQARLRGVDQVDPDVPERALLGEQGSEFPDGLAPNLH